jgi:hypothetical protein
VPRAENRKKPPNLQGGVAGSGPRQKNGSFRNPVEREQAQSRKQDLLERMKKIQQNKKGTE